MPHPSACLPDALLARAHHRLAPGEAFAGHLTPTEAYRLVELGEAVLVDVRTRPEWEYVGHVPGAPLVEWRAYGAPAPNPEFVHSLERVAPRDATVLFLCRSGVRSIAAAQAAAQAGWSRACNVLEGFEGDLDETGRRGSRGGWRQAGLPWRQT